MGRMGSRTRRQSREQWSEICSNVQKSEIPSPLTRRTSSHSLEKLISLFGFSKGSESTSVEPDYNEPPGRGEVTHGDRTGRSRPSPEGASEEMREGRHPHAGSRFVLARFLSLSSWAQRHCQIQLHLRRNEHQRRRLLLLRRNGHEKKKRRKKTRNEMLVDEKLKDSCLSPLLLQLADQHSGSKHTQTALSQGYQKK